MSRTLLLRLITTLAVGFLGGWLFSFLQIPLAWMLGPLLANLLVSLAGMPVGIKPGFRAVFLGSLGVILGGQASQDTLQQASNWPGSLALLTLGVILIILGVSIYFRRMAGFDQASAWFSAVPGAMTSMILMGGQAGGDERKITLAHALRLTFVVLLVPSLFWVFYTPPPTSENPLFQEAQNLWLLAGILPAWWLGKRLRLPTPEFTAPLFMSVTAAVNGYAFTGTQTLVAATFLVLGASIGARFYGTRPGELLWLGKHALGATLVALSLAAFSAWMMHWLLGLPFATAMLTMTPGGIGEMAMVALALGVDPVFIAVHHLFRILALMLIIPFLVRFWRN
ncbi:AbrB family transcriptional regulator [Marinospirillum perlucidum]|uniref:AbrB family transcriptional regulator n=1 Tax=Marinospirillum perlucidum TaxID=1982602 RepID=UPI000DF342A1|nr:AbrB family transcriptional regulator [Marinospirillum perlucidum]